MRDTSWDARARGAIIMKLNIDPHIFAGIAQLRLGAGKKDIRAELHGVYVEPQPQGGVIIQATNGNAAGLWLDTNGFAERPALLRVDDKMVGHCAKAQADAVVSIVGGSLVFIRYKNQKEYASQGHWELEGEFPDLKKTIPIIDGDPALRDAVNPKLLSQMRKCLKIGAGIIGTIGVELRQNPKSAYAPIICTSAYAPLFCGAMMPVRYAHAPQPKWVKAWVAAPLPAAPLPVHEPSDAAPPDGDGGAQS